MTIAKSIEARLQTLGDPQRALVSRRFFKTGPGEYGEGDRFIGLRVPELRKLEREYRSLRLSEALQLLQSPLHEARMLALFILIGIYTHGEGLLQEEIYRAYLRHTRFINNWDLVDASAEHIVGAHLWNGDREQLQSLACSKLLWERRIAIIATFHYIKRGEFAETFNLAKLLLHDPEDLLHKAVGWMLREVGKRDQPAEEAFLRTHYRGMPRTMLRYAIEKFPEDLRKRYLRGTVAHTESHRGGKTD